MDKLQYFAALPKDKIGDALIEKKQKYYEHLEKSGRFSLLKLSHMLYYKASFVDGRLRQTGDNFEYTEINVNHYRNLIQHTLSLTASQRPAFDAKATNTDVKSLSQAQLANGLLEYYLRFKKLERFVRGATELGCYQGEGWVYSGWNASSGEQYGETENGAPIYEGDLEFKVYGPVDVIRDVLRPEKPLKWVMLRNYQNKFDLAAQYPELKERILAVNPESYDDLRFNFREFKEARKDDIPVYWFFHEKTPALPNGRIVMLVDSDIILIDGPLPYRELPVYSIIPAEKDGSVFGYTNIWDLMPIQQAYDKLASTILSNQAAFGIQNIGVPKGNDLEVTQIAGGLNMIEYDPKAGPPVPLQLTQTAPEVFTFVTMLQEFMETLSGINSVARGNPEQSLKSGSALALVQSMAIQFSQSLQQSYAQLLEDLGTSVINNLRDYATVPRIALIAGKSNRSKMKEFKGDDLSLVNRVLVDMGNPMAKTLAGKANLAEQLIQGGFIKNPQQYLEVLTTGRIEPLYEGEVAELNLIRAENENLSEGQPVTMIQTDDHAMHIMEHKVVLASPEARTNPEIVMATLQHIQEHQLAMMPPQQMQMSPDAPQGTVSGDPSAAQALDATNPATQEAATVNMPNMPKLPGE